MIDNLVLSIRLEIIFMLIVQSCRGFGRRLVFSLAGTSIVQIERSWLEFDIMIL